MNKQLYTFVLHWDLQILQMALTAPFCVTLGSPTILPSSLPAILLTLSEHQFLNL